MSRREAQVRALYGMPFFIATLIIASLIMVGMITSAFAQNPAPPAAPASNPHVIRVQTGYSCGMCGGLGYRSILTTVEPTFLLSEEQYSSNPKELPNRKTKVRITKQDWKNLLRSIDASALRALPKAGVVVPVETCRNHGWSSNTAMGARLR